MSAKNLSEAKVVKESSALSLDFPQVNEEFFVALRAEERRFDDADRVETRCEGGAPDLVDDARVLVGAAHHALGSFSFADFELRLDERDDLAPAREQVAHGGKNEPQRNERRVDRCDFGRFGEPMRLQTADVGLLENGDARVASEHRRDLIAADVDGIDAALAGGEQAMREPAGRGADVEGDPS